MPTPYEVGLGGKRNRITEVCFVAGKLAGNPVDVTALVVEELGVDEEGQAIDLLFGADAMEVWNIKLDPKAGKLDLSRMRREFIYYNHRRSLPNPGPPH